VPFHPLVLEWFSGRFARATDVQFRAWPAIESGRDVLISAPTGSGKTLAAFLGCLDRLVRAARDTRRSGTGTDAITVAPADPLNLAGIILPGPRVNAQRTTVVTLG
jgi:ATP-dependent Lhr-like helicase